MEQFSESPATPVRILWSFTSRAHCPSDCPFPGMVQRYFLSSGDHSLPPGGTALEVLSERLSLDPVGNQTWAWHPVVPPAALEPRR
jgi:hypothetical protein